MTVSATASRQTYNGDGVTVAFPVPFYFLANSDLQVYIGGVLKTLTTDYSVSGAGVSAGGTIACVSAPAVGTGNIVIIRDPDQLQSSQLPSNDPFPSKTVETGLDKLTMLIQRARDLIGRSMTLSDADISGASTILPTPVANNFLGWNSAANAIINYAGVVSVAVSAYMSTVLAAANAAAARTLLGSSAVGDAIFTAVSAAAARASLAAAALGINSDITVLSALISLPSSPHTQDFRLTLTTAVPVTTADVTGAVTIFCTPYKGKSIALYDGSTRWNERQSAEFSLGLGTLTSGKPYDVFCFDNAGVPTLEFLAWTNDTTRATALVYQDGVLVKSGATTRRYMGTFYTTATTTTEDSQAKRFLWNYYHRVVRSMLRREAAASWAYTTATPRQANANVANQLDFIRGLDEDAIDVNLLATFSNASTIGVGIGLGLDSTTTMNIGQGSTGFNPSASAFSAMTANYKGLPGVGRHFVAWLETSTATGATTWYGANNAPGAIGGNYYTGLSGSLMA